MHLTGEINTDKKSLRRSFSATAAELDEQYKSKASADITDRILSSPFYINAKSIFVYVSTQKEPDTSFFIKKALEDGKTVYVPKCIKKGIMIPVEITADTVFEECFMGLYEPKEFDEKLKLSQIDLSIIPCVSASLSGKRLGHGGGFYDIFLENIKTFKACVCFDALIQNDIPTEKHDILMDAVITENGFFII